MVTNAVTIKNQLVLTAQAIAPVPTSQIPGKHYSQDANYTRI
ncbi:MULTISPECIES: hypothetical protein [unclassified Anabaena]